MWIEIPWLLGLITAFLVTPGAGVWIEIDTSMPIITHHTVTPGAGVWIEISVAPHESSIP